MSKTEHTHRLARAYSHIVEGKRVEGRVGDPITPTKNQLRNQPDCFVSEDGTKTKAPSNTTGIKAVAASSAVDHVAGITDREVLEAMLEEEQTGRERVTVTRAIEDRLDELDEELDPAEDGEQEDDG